MRSALGAGGSSSKVDLSTDESHERGCKKCSKLCGGHLSFAQREREREREREYIFSPGAVHF